MTTRLHGQRRQPGRDPLDVGGRGRPARPDAVDHRRRRLLHELRVAQLLARPASSSFCAAARSRPSRARSAATSIAPEVSSSTCTAPPDSTTSTVAVGAKPVARARPAGPATRRRAAGPRQAGLVQPDDPGGDPAAVRDPCSVRNRRTSVTSFCRSATRVAAAASTGAPASTGHGATTTDSPPVSAVHSASVMNGIDRVQQPQQRVEDVPEHRPGAVAPSPRRAAAAWPARRTSRRTRPR